MDQEEAALMDQLGMDMAPNMSASFEQFLEAATREEALAAVDTIANLSRLASLGRHHRCPRPCPHRHHPRRRHGSPMNSRRRHELYT